MIYIANNVEFDRFTGQTLLPIDRFDYLEKLVQRQALDLQEIHEDISKKRKESFKNSQSVDYEELQSAYEYMPIPIFRLDDSNKVSAYKQPFRVAFVTYLNYILCLNNTDKTLIQLPPELIQRPYYENSSESIKGQTNDLQKSMYFLLGNGYRSLRTHVRNATIFFQKSYFDELESNPFLAVTIIGIMMSMLTFGLILIQTWQIQRNKGRILSLYAYLSTIEITKVYNACLIFMENLNTGSIMGGSQDGGIDSGIVGSVVLNGAMQNAITGVLPLSGVVMGDSNQELALIHNSMTTQQDPLRSGGSMDMKVKIVRKSIMSEEEKDAIEQKMLIELRKKQRQMELKKNNRASAADVYTQMIKLAFNNIRIIINKEDVNQSHLATTNRQNLLKKQSNGGIKKQNQNKKLEKGGDATPQKKSKQLNQNKKGKQALKTTGFEDGVFKEENSSKWLQKKEKRFAIQSGNVNPTKKHIKKTQKDNVVEIQSPRKKRRTQEQLDDINSHSDNEEESKDQQEASADNQENEGEESHNEKSESDGEKRQRRRRDKTEQELDLNRDAYQEQTERKAYFMKTIKNQQWSRVVITVLLLLSFCSYFVQLYIYNGQFKFQITQIQFAIPLMLGRFRHHMLAYAILRERILLNNTMDYLEFNPIYGYDLDQQKIEESMLNEQTLAALKVSHSYIINGLFEFLERADSENFCRDIVLNDRASQNIVFTDSSLEDNVSPDKVRTARPYQALIQTIVQAQQAAIEGNVTKLKNLRQKDVDLGSFNYDRRTMLHYAAKYGRLEAVQYLASLGVNVNNLDRWGASPLTYGAEFPAVRAFLVSIGGIMGPNSENFKTLSSLYEANELKENDYRVFYAAYFDDLESLKILNQQGVLDLKAADKDGRTALSIAAAQGSLNAVKYLLSQGADPARRDARYHNTMYDAKKENRDAVVNYLETRLNENIIINYCSEFQNGLLSTGLLNAVGNFHKRFADLMIKVKNRPISLSQTQLLLGSPLAARYNNDSQYNSQSFEMFYQTQELYYSLCIDQTLVVIREVFNAYIEEYRSVTQILFILFLAFLLIMFLYLRQRFIKKMRKDIFKSRGILNLIPDSFFEQNRTKVEKLIRNLKD